MYFGGNNHGCQEYSKNVYKYTQADRLVSAVRTLRYSQIHSKSVAIVKNVPVHLQMELVDLQCNGDLKSKFYLVKLYGEYIPNDKCPGLVNQARTLTALQVQDSKSDATN